MTKHKQILTPTNHNECSHMLDYINPYTSQALYNKLWLTISSTLYLLMRNELERQFKYYD